MKAKWLRKKKNSIHINIYIYIYCLQWLKCAEKVDFFFFFLQASLFCIVRELAGVWSAAVAVAVSKT